MKRRVGILISGRGSNMAALLEAARDPAVPAEIVLVLSNRPDAGGLAVAAAAGVATAALSLDSSAVSSAATSRAPSRAPPPAGVATA